MWLPLRFEGFEHAENAWLKGFRLFELVLSIRGLCPPPSMKVHSSPNCLKALDIGTLLNMSDFDIDLCYCTIFLNMPQCWVWRIATLLNRTRNDLRFILCPTLLMKEYRVIQRQVILENSKCYSWVHRQNSTSGWRWNVWKWFDKFI